MLQETPCLSIMPFSLHVSRLHVTKAVATAVVLETLTTRIRSHPPETICCLAMVVETWVLHQQLELITTAMVALTH